MEAYVLPRLTWERARAVLSTEGLSSNWQCSRASATSSCRRCISSSQRPSSRSTAASASLAFMRCIGVFSRSSRSVASKPVAASVSAISPSAPVSSAHWLYGFLPALARRFFGEATRWYWCSSRSYCARRSSALCAGGSARDCRALDSSFSMRCCSFSRLSTRSCMTSVVVRMSCRRPCPASPASMLLRMTASTRSTISRSCACSPCR
mmetsp:Transcript_9553/g.24327  ORF Transcript_9553/g.24327 Transcript_9553/m.24327 type:complete len:208 (-) Transcript_9553:331-954(-)